MLSKTHDQHGANEPSSSELRGADAKGYMLQSDDIEDDSDEVNDEDVAAGETRGIICPCQTVELYNNNNNNDDDDDDDDDNSDDDDDDDEQGSYSDSGLLVSSIQEEAMFQVAHLPIPRSSDVKAPGTQTLWSDWIPSTSQPPDLLKDPHPLGVANLISTIAETSATKGSTLGSRNDGDFEDTVPDTNENQSTILDGAMTLSIQTSSVDCKSDISESLGARSPRSSDSSGPNQAQQPLGVSRLRNRYRTINKSDDSSDDPEQPISPSIDIQHDDPTDHGVNRDTAILISSGSYLGGGLDHIRGNTPEVRDRGQLSNVSLYSSDFSDNSELLGQNGYLTENNHASIVSGQAEAADAGAHWLDHGEALFQSSRGDAIPENNVSSSQDSNPSVIITGDRSHGIETPSQPEFRLSDEQDQVFQAVVRDGKNVFCTGPAGTGKSVLLRAIVAGLRAKYGQSDVIGITAMTGLAANHINGRTIHNFAGIGRSEIKASDVRKRAGVWERWKTCRTLIIDEISMMSGELFDGLQQLARELRGADHQGRKWGGIQIVATGDFLQLPPIAPGNDKVKFAFEADCWNSTFDHFFILRKVLRQEDTDWIRILNSIRIGALSDGDCRIIEALARKLEPKDGIALPELYPKRSEVTDSNTRKLRELPDGEKEFLASDAVSYSRDWKGDKLGEGETTTMFDAIPAARRLVLKKGAVVMLIKNQSEDMVNGSIGKIVDFQRPDDMPPTEKHAVEYPVVMFPKVGQVLMKPVDFTTEARGSLVTLRRKQVPLILAWAVSIHKSQGQTLDRGRVDLGHIFEFGQAYVALSRVKTMENLQVLHFTKSKIMVNDKVQQFYQALDRICRQDEGRKDNNDGEKDNDSRGHNHRQEKRHKKKRQTPGGKKAGKKNGGTGPMDKFVIKQ